MKNNEERTIFLLLSVTYKIYMLLCHSYFHLNLGLIKWDWQGRNFASEENEALPKFTQHVNH